jgi:hypothetical protein
MYGNPNLDSDTATVESASVFGEEGISRLPVEQAVRPSQVHSSLPVLDLDASDEDTVGSDGVNSENEDYSQEENGVLDFREQAVEEDEVNESEDEEEDEEVRN